MVAVVSHRPHQLLFPSFYPRRCRYVLFLLVQIVFDFTEVKVFAGAAAESVEDVETGRLEV